MGLLLEWEATFWGCNYNPSILFERTLEVEDIANDTRLLEALSAWAGKTIKRGDEAIDILIINSRD